MNNEGTKVFPPTSTRSVLGFPADFPAPPLVPEPLPRLWLGEAGRLRPAWPESRRNWQYAPSADVLPNAFQDSEYCALLDNKPHRRAEFSDRESCWQWTRRGRTSPDQPDASPVSLSRFPGKLSSSWGTDIAVSSSRTATQINMTTQPDGVVHQCTEGVDIGGEWSNNILSSQRIPAAAATEAVLALVDELSPVLGRIHEHMGSRDPSPGEVDSLGRNPAAPWFATGVDRRSCRCDWECVTGASTTLSPRVRMPKHTAPCSTLAGAAGKQMNSQESARSHT